MEKLIQLEVNDWPKFKEQLKNLHSTEIHQIEAQIKLKEFIINQGKIQSKKKYTKFTAQTQTTSPENTKSLTQNKGHTDL